MKIFAVLLFAFIFALTVDALVYATIDSFASPTLIFLVVQNGNQEEEDAIWYSPYTTGSNNGDPQAFLFQDTTDALGGQRDSIVGYKGTTPTNSAAVLSTLPGYPAIAFPLNYNGAAYFQWDGVDTTDGDSNPFPGCTLNTLPGIGSQNNLGSPGIGAGTIDFTLSNRAAGITIEIQTDSVIKYVLNVIDSFGIINTLFFNVLDNEEEFTFFLIRFDDPTWSLDNFNFNDVAGFEIVVINPDSTVATDTAFRFLNIFGYVVSGTVVIDCSCDGSSITASSGEVITMEGTNVDVSLATTTEADGSYQFDSHLIVDGIYELCYQDTTRDLCPSSNRCYTITINAQDVFADFDFHIVFASTLYLPDDVIVPCDSCTDVICQESATIAGCDSIIDTPTFTDTESTEGCDVIISRRWENPNTSAFGIQTITIRDEEAPVIATPASPRTLLCDEPSTYDDFISSQGDALAIETCTSFTWSTSINSAPVDCDFETVIFTATDSCGNFADTQATYTVIDGEGPAFTILPANEEAQCDLKSGSSDTALAQWNAKNTGDNASDNCSPLNTLEFDSTFVGFPSGCDNSETVTFSVTDRCGNSVSTDASFRIFDDTPPSIITPPSDLNLSCSQDRDAVLQTWLDSHGGAAASDLCIADDAGLMWSNNDSGTGIGCTATAVTFSVQDGCGSTSSAVASYVLIDITPPEITTQASDFVISCDSFNINDFNAWILDNAGATATDDCGTVSFTNDVSFVPSCGDNINVVFTATDACSNTSTTSANVNIFDIVCHESCEACVDTISCQTCPEDDNILLGEDSLCHVIIQEPAATNSWSLYFNGCISWPVNAFAEGEMGTFTLQTGASFENELIIHTDYVLDDGQFDWIIYGILPSESARIEAVFESGTVHSEIFSLTVTTGGSPHTCLALT